MHFLKTLQVTSLLLALGAGRAVASPGNFEPDPAAVQRFGPAYRYPQAGWIVLHIEGDPYERGVQHGRLMGSEIAAHIESFALTYSSEAPDDAWNLTRLLTQAVFLSRFDREYLEEMRGIADGATAAGAKFDDRPLDLVDIAALNLWPEIMTLPWAAEAIPTGLEGTKFPDGEGARPLPLKPGHCSAFAATGPATADGTVVFGHITMFSLYPSTFYNVWLDVKPSKGHRVLMQSFPGGIHSGMDYYINDAGLLVSETTIDQTRFEALGRPLSSRIRQALQYADSIDKAVELLLADNNGLYTNEWLLADIKTNEIAMFELGTKTHKLYRSSKGEWFGGTEGFYWGCNNTKDLGVRMETIAGVNDRPANMVWRPSDRDRAWLRLYEKHKGKIGVDFGREAFTTPPICASSSVDAKFTTSALAKDLKSWAIFGPPREKTWLPTDYEKREYPAADPLVSNPWTILHGDAPRDTGTTTQAVDLRDNAEAKFEPRPRPGQPDAPVPPAKLVWRGTLLPKSDGDIWLAAAFADYHAIVAREQGLLALSEDECLCAADLGKLATNLYAAKARYCGAANSWQDVPLSQITSSNERVEWYRIAAGKGVLALSELRRQLGDERFVEALDTFGVAHAGNEVSWRDFAAHVTRIAGEDLSGFFEYWVTKPGLPTLGLERAEVRVASGDGDPERMYRVEGVLTARSGPMPSRIEATVETGPGEEVTRVVSVEATSGAFQIEVDAPPVRLVVDKYGRVAKANGGVLDIPAPLLTADECLIVYGTLDEEAGNREAAEVLQDSIQRRRTNVTVPIVSDSVVTEEQLRDRHLLLVGRPATNRITQRFRDALPVSFGAQSFTVSAETYAHYRSAVIVAAANPENRRYGVTVIAGLSPLATYKAASEIGFADLGVEAKIIPLGRKARNVVVPPAELVRSFPTPDRVSKRASE